MSLFWKRVLMSVFFGLVVPGVMFSTSKKVPEPSVSPPAVERQLWIPVIGEDGRVRAMELEDYVCRVVLGEMPASFDAEALKAQSVAVRTYTLRTVMEGDRHAGAVCTDYACCQEYQDPEAYLEAGGTQENVDKVFMAAEQTRGQVLYHGDEVILATYFACAGGRTEDAEAVWGASYPYLQSVDSPEITKYDDDVVELSGDAFCETIGRCLEGTPDGWIGNVTYTKGGGVASVWIGGQRYSGVEVRSLFGLRSTVFEVEAQADTILFRTKGYGHRVGLSQYGADALAREGLRYEQILAHYYPGTELHQFRND